jgi:hypothetical protein
VDEQIIYIANVRMIDCHEKIQRLVRPRFFDHSEATKDFGFSPIDFKVGVEEKAKEYLNRSYRSSDQ